MSSFTSDLMVSVSDDGRIWIVRRSFTYHVGSQHSRTWITVPKGFSTDWASIPKWIAWLLPEWAKYNKIAPVHDLLYRVQSFRVGRMDKPITRKKADDIFLEGMKVIWRKYPKRAIIAYLEYFAVRIFAWPAWRSRR